MKAEKILETLEPVEENEEVQLPPLQTSPEWHNYVMSHFTADELVEGCPTVDGLRRVTELLLGKIVAVNCRVVSGVNPYVFIASVCITNHQYIEMVVEDVGEADSNFMNEPFCFYPAATAMTRAESRALRKALRLRKVISVEEKQGQISAPTAPSMRLIEDSQVMAIKKTCERKGLVLDEVLKQYNVADLKELSFEQASKVISSMHTETK